MNYIFLQVFYAIFSGLAQGISISNEFIQAGSPLAALFCLVPLYIALYKTKSYKEAFLVFFVQTLTVHLFSSFWLANFHGFAAFTLGASAFGTALEGGLCGIVIRGIVSLHDRKFKLEEYAGRHISAIPVRIFCFASGIVFWEWIKSTGFLGYPWGTMSMAVWKWRIFTQIASITGVWGITFLWSLENALLGECILLIAPSPLIQVPHLLKYSINKTAKAVAVFFALSFIYGLYEFVLPRIPTKYVNTVIVQQNVDPWECGDKVSVPLSMRLTEEKVNEFKEYDFDTDLVLWSEGTLERLFPRDIFHYEAWPDEESLTNFIKRINCPFIIGGTTLINRSPRAYSNSAIFFDAEGNYSGFYSKMHLVPFAENIPFMDVPLMKWFMSDVVGFSGTLTPGSQYVLFKIPIKSSTMTPSPLNIQEKNTSILELDHLGRSDPKQTINYITSPVENPNNFVLFSTPICFEDAFPVVCRKLYKMGSEVFMNITNDSWSKMASSEYQHFIVASYLSIEFRTTLVRCANAGYSVVVDPAGKIIKDLPVFTEDALSYRVPIYKRSSTPYAIFGDWFAYSLFAAAFLIILLTSLYKIKK